MTRENCPQREGKNTLSPATDISKFSIIAVDKFIQATRDSGYKGTSSAIAEIVDNAIQACARHVNIQVVRAANGDDDSIELTVQDDGEGMDSHVLRQALRFGGSSRFNDRNGLGRYGMGLPNSSLSQARRVTVYTWQPDSPIYKSYLDVDEVASGAMRTVPAPRKSKLPFKNGVGNSGTIIYWSRCDRLDNRRISTIVRKLLSALGRRFRYFIWDGIQITVNGDPVQALDPLFLHPASENNGAKLFGEVLEYEVQASPDNGDHTIGNVKVRFAELPVHDWQMLSHKEKRRLGISKGAGISVVRAGREVDYGWFFLGGKRRENYDDWWRCEIQFDPVLDEAFGITHTKQQIRPKAYLLEALSPDIETTARVLNARARKAHLVAKAAVRFSESENIASEREKLLKPLPDCNRERDKNVLDFLKPTHPALQKTLVDSPEAQITSSCGGIEYKIIEAEVRDRSFFTYARDGSRIVLALNPSHPFYKHIYRPLVDSNTPRDRQLRTQIELLLLALARAEVTEQNNDVLTWLEHHRINWSNTLATFLNK